jgi:arginine:pyruvate transaminase
MPERVVTLGSLSKSHSMPGFRAGWLVGPREFTANAEALSMCMLFGLPGFIQEAALTASRSRRKRRAAACANSATSRRERFMAGLQGVPNIRAFAPEAGMFLLLDVSDTGSVGLRIHARPVRAPQGIGVGWRGVWASHTAHFVRICFATEEATIDAACARIRQFCEQDLP